MISTRDIRRRIRAIRNIEQICRAMKTVSMVKLRHAEARLVRARAYHRAIQRLASELAAAAPEHPLFAPREIKRTGFAVIASDKGLAGGYNANVIRFAAAETRKRANVAVFPLGRRAADFFRRHGYELLGRLSPIGAEPAFAEVVQVADELSALYATGRLDEVVLVYSHFLSSARSEIVAERLLPVPPAPAAREEQWLFEPSPDKLVDELLPRLVRNAVYIAALEASASEHAARVLAMTTASDNANDMIRDLTMAYNRARQATITRELIEIAGTAEALR